MDRVKERSVLRTEGEREKGDKKVDRKEEKKGVREKPERSREEERRRA